MWEMIRFFSAFAPLSPPSGNGNSREKLKKLAAASWSCPGCCCHLQCRIANPLSLLIYVRILRAQRLREARSACGVHVQSHSFQLGFCSTRQQKNPTTLINPHKPWEALQKPIVHIYKPSIHCPKGGLGVCSARVGCSCVAWLSP